MATFNAQFNENSNFVIELNSNLDYVLPPATANTLGGIKVGDNLKISGGVLSVDTATEVQQDNTKPITSAAVYTTVGNIEALLETI